MEGGAKEGTNTSAEISHGHQVRAATWLPLRVALVYAAVATAWILFSDDLVETLVPDRSRAATWQTYKGIGFVLTTAAVLLVVLRRRLRVLQRASEARLKAEKEIQLLNADLERRVAERTRELEVKNRELARFSYTVSHDLKAPLGRIEGFSRLLETEHAAALDGDGRRFVEAIRRSTVEMAALIDDLFAYARVEQRELQPACVSLVNLVNGVLTECEPELRTRTAEVKLSLACDQVTADFEGLRTALRNLVGNAIKFTPKDRAPRLEIGTRREGEQCVIWVRDEGIGFDMSYHARIFEIFERLHGTAEYPGTGVGLAIVLKAMERMGGTAHAESKPGAGATFFLKFPVSETEPA